MRKTIIGGVALSAVFAAGLAMPQDTTPKRLPYAAVHDPEFIAPADATFLHDEDRVIGLMAGTTAKAYPAAILSQHGLVEDKTPKGPIGVTW